MIIKSMQCSEPHSLVLLQAMKEDPPLDARCRDKFLVQSVSITPNRESSNIAAIVSTVVRGVETC